MTYQPKTSQFEHQRTVLDSMWDRPGFALFWEQGTGKTKALIDNAARLFEAGAIDGLFVIAPNVLHRNFIEKELPKHLPDRIDRLADFYQTSKAGTQRHDARMVKLLHTGPQCLAVLAMSYDSVLTDIGRGVANAFLTKHRCLYGLDESARIKEVDTNRTKMILKSAKFAPFRRVMSGTPVSNAPWDVWSQIKFCDLDFWKQYGLDDIKAMKTTFGLWETGRRRVNIAEARGKNGGIKYGYIIKDGSAFKEFPMPQRDDSGRKVYKDLGRLKRLIEPIRSRVLKDDVFDLPPKLYTRIDVDLAPDQARAYESMTKLGFAMLDDGGVSTSKLAMNTITKLQQITSGWLPVDPTEEDPEIRRVTHFKKNPKLEALSEIIEDMDVQGLIWARFRADIDLICNLMTAKGKTFARYDGFVDQDERFEGDERFHKGDAQFSIGTPEAGGEGRTLTEAQTVVHYSNNWKLNDRLQAEDRAHRWGQTKSVNYLDLVARYTVDETILETLQSKLDVASAVQGDAFRHWLSLPGRLL